MGLCTDGRMLTSTPSLLRVHNLPVPSAAGGHRAPRPIIIWRRRLGALACASPLSCARTLRLRPRRRRQRRRRWERRQRRRRQEWRARGGGGRLLLPCRVSFALLACLLVRLLYHLVVPIVLLAQPHVTCAHKSKLLMFLPRRWRVPFLSATCPFRLLPQVLALRLPHRVLLGCPAAARAQPCGQVSFCRLPARWHKEGNMRVLL